MNAGNNESTPVPIIPSFFSRLDERARAIDSLLCVGLDPHPEFLPVNTASEALSFCMRLVDQTHDIALAFKPNIAFFEVLGGNGIDALRDIITYIHSIDPTIPVILDAKRADIASTADAYARAAFETLGADSVTVNPYLGYDAIAPFLKHPGRGVFVLCRTSNPGAGLFQEAVIDMGGRQDTLYRVVARRAAEWNEENNVGVVMGATDASKFKGVRELAPDLWMLVPGIGAQGGELTDVLWEGLRPDGLGVLINVSRSVARASNPRAEAIAVRDQIRAVQSYRRGGADVNPAQSTIARLAWALASAECVRFGRFTLKSGHRSPIYLDLRRLVGSPHMLRVVAELVASRLAQLSFDHIAAIPYAALPIGTGAAMVGGYSLIYPRRETKNYGTKAEIEGVFKAGDTAVVLDDLATTGDSKFEVIARLTQAGLSVRDVVVVIDREQGARAALEAQGLRFHALITLTELLDALVHQGRISPDQRQEVETWRTTGVLSSDDETDADAT